MQEIYPENFPKNLRNIPDPPKKLFIKGVLPNPENYTYLCIVGSRNYSPYGHEACKKIIEGLAGYPIVIVSGLALGIDALAHETALAHNLPTVALPGSGLDDKVLYPARNFSLAQKILHNGGALVSELSPATEGAPWTFPRRNRIMAGISDAILIIEAREKSGTKITARLALDYGRDVYVIPGSIFSSNSAGTNSLIREGAMPITSSEELLEALGFTPAKPLQANLFDTCSPAEQEILKLLKEPLSRGNIARILKKPIGEISILISEMEMSGFIQEIDGKITRK